MKNFVFDFDGTLVNSMKAWGDKMINILIKRGISYPDDVVKTITPLGDRGTALYFIEKFGLSESVAELIAEMDEYALPKYRDEIQAKDTVLETLIFFKEKGSSLNVLTASPHKMLDPCLKRLGLWDLFDNVWSCDDFGTTKSDEGIYRSVAEKLGVDVADCVFLDDNSGALKTAKRAGMSTVGVYDFSSADDEKTIRDENDFYVVKMNELKNLF